MLVYMLVVPNVPCVNECMNIQHTERCFLLLNCMSAKGHHSNYRYETYGIYQYVLPAAIEIVRQLSKKSCSQTDHKYKS